MEGIETCGCGLPLCMRRKVSVGAPTWRGLKLHRNPLISQGNAPGVSRCPDMEGIETVRYETRTTRPRVSVGAPTWRGLKPLVSFSPSTQPVSVGAPTWRGLKLAGRS